MKIVFAPGPQPDTGKESLAGVTWHYRTEDGRKFDPPAYFYASHVGPEALFGADCNGEIAPLMDSEAKARAWVEERLKAAGYDVFPHGGSKVFKDADVSVTMLGADVAFGVQMPKVHPTCVCGQCLARPGMAMVVGGDMKFHPHTGSQPAICHGIDYVTGDIFSIPATVSDAEVMALLDARRRYVENARNAATNGADATDADGYIPMPDNDEVN